MTGTAARLVMGLSRCAERSSSISWFRWCLHGRPVRLSLLRRSLYTSTPATSTSEVPMRQLPALKVRADGKTLVLGQTTAILRYLGKKFGLVPDDDDQQALCDMYAEQVHDLTNPIAEQQWSQFTKSSTELEQEMFPGKAVGIANRLGKLFSGPLEQGRGYLVDGKLTYADLALAELADKLMTIAKRKDLFDEYPAVQRHHKQIYSLGQLRDYASGRPKYSF